MQIETLGGEDALEKDMATRSSILAEIIPQTEESGGLRSIGLQRVGLNWACKNASEMVLSTSAWIQEGNLEDERLEEVS